MDSLKNGLHKKWMGFATKFMGDMKESVFLSKGKLTPDEFVYVGDTLIEICPTWSWEAGDSKKRNKNLPDDKQYLMTKDVPSMMRATDLMDDSFFKESLDEEDGWVIADTKQENVEEIDSKVEDEKKEEDDDSVGDIDDSSSDEDDNVFAKKAASEEKKDDGVQKCRRYDISLTYDEYYKTPRFWLSGYDENK